VAPLSPALCVSAGMVWEGEESSGALDRPAGLGEEEGKERKRARREANFFFRVAAGEDFLVDG
jgi:hypothetical protein